MVLFLGQLIVRIILAQSCKLQLYFLFTLVTCSLIEHHIFLCLAPFLLISCWNLQYCAVKDTGPVFGKCIFYFLRLCKIFAFRKHKNFTFETFSVNCGANSQQLSEVFLWSEKAFIPSLFRHFHGPHFQDLLHVLQIFLYEWW